MLGQVNSRLQFTEIQQRYRETDQQALILGRDYIDTAAAIRAHILTQFSRVTVQLRNPKFPQKNPALCFFIVLAQTPGFDEA